uniref:Uncharacterized protein n=1 Tax=Acrobeloides nanus TaxID=290746 RepID=A0A914DNH2_9BILA
MKEHRRFGFLKQLKGKQLIQKYSIEWRKFLHSTLNLQWERNLLTAHTKEYGYLCYKPAAIIEIALKSWKDQFFSLNIEKNMFTTVYNFLMNMNRWPSSGLLPPEIYNSYDLLGFLPPHYSDIPGKRPLFMLNTRPTPRMNHLFCQIHINMFITNVNVMISDETLEEDTLTENFSNSINRSYIKSTLNNTNVSNEVNKETANKSDTSFVVRCFRVRLNAEKKSRITELRRQLENGEREPFKGRYRRNMKTHKKQKFRKVVVCFNEVNEQNEKTFHRNNYVKMEREFTKFLRHIGSNAPDSYDRIIFIDNLARTAEKDEILGYFSRAGQVRDYKRVAQKII